jgi:hypothetical protein
MHTIIYRAHPVRNKNRTLYVGRTRQHLQKYIHRRHLECFVSNPSSRRPLFTFLRKAYKTIENTEENISWETLEIVPSKRSHMHVRRREQYWISRLKPLLNARNEILFFSTKQ